MEQDRVPTFPPPAPLRPATPATSTTPATPIDPAVQARLDRLAASRSSRPVPAADRGATPGGRSRRRHAARRGRAAAALMGATTAIGLSAYFHSTDSVGTSEVAASPTGDAVAVTPPNASATASSAAPSSSAMADGTYAGATDTNRYGPVQVQITVDSGQITDVTARQTPTGDRKSVAINRRAIPTLATEVLSAQSADIDTVSGATYTTDSYTSSLQSAIDLATSTTRRSSQG